ncbi:MAG: cation:proton antiporter subunit C [Candidatus Omnitrophica bacterium]|nr:cation:proton antiporter subunit C [Candidatus Omnitrophota bacterium]
MLNQIVGLFNYGATFFLILFGIYIMIVRNNYFRKTIGMVILQTGVILFFISIAAKWGASIPIIPHDLHGTVDPTLYENPLPHALMLTAIVVGVSTLGVALTLLVSIFRSYHTLEEDKILKEMGDRK